MFKQLKLAALLSSVSAATLLCASPVNAVILIELAVSGQAAPDGNGTYAIFSDPVVGDGGHVAFKVLYTGTGGGSTDDEAIIRVENDGASQIQVARRGQVAVDGNGTLDVLPSFPAKSVSKRLNRAGQIVLPVQYSGTSGGFADQQAILRVEADGSQTQVVRGGQAAPDGNGVFAGVASVPSINDAGQVSHAAGFSGTVGGASDDSGLMRIEANGSVTQVLREGDLAPDGVNTFAAFLGSNINNSGQISFLTRFNNVLGDNVATRVEADGTPTIVLAPGQSAPDGNGTVSTIDGLPAFNDSGQTVIATQMIGTVGGASDDQVLIRTETDGTTLTQVARKSDAAPDGNGTIESVKLDSPTIGSAGHVAFFANYAGTSGGTADNTGIVRSDTAGSNLMSLAREGEATPDGISNYTVLGNPHLNGKGEIAFGASTDGGPANQSVLVYVEADGLTKHVFARAGDSTPSGSSFDGFSTVDINEDGNIAFKAGIASGQQGIFVAVTNAVWTGASSNQWDDAGNWMYGVNASDFDPDLNVTVSTDTSQTIFGPAGAASVKSLTIGGGTGLTTYDVNGGSITAANGVHVQDKGHLTGNGHIVSDITNFGETHISGLTIDGNIINDGELTGSNKINGALFNGPNGSVNVGNGEKLEFANAGSVNAGDINVIGGTLEFENGLTNEAGGDIVGITSHFDFGTGLVNAGDFGTGFGANLIDGNVENQIGGRIANSGNGQQVFLDNVHNDGQLNVAGSGETIIFGDYSGAGSLTGSGTLFLEGNVSIGSSPALIAATVNIDLSNAGTTEMEIEGLLRGIQYDALDTTQTLTLGGDLSVVFLNGFKAETGDTFVLFMADEIIGSFDNIYLPDLDTANWKVVQTKTSLSVEAVPVPAMLWPFAGLAAGAVWAARRKR